MDSFHQQRSNKIAGKSRFVVVALAALLAGGGAFAAVGGAQGVRQFFGTLKIIGPDGVEQNLVIEEIGETGDPAVLEIDLGDGKTATMQIERIVSDDGSLEEVVDTQMRVELGVDDTANNRAFFTNEVSDVGSRNTTIQVQMSDDGAAPGQTLTVDVLPSPEPKEGMHVVTVSGSSEAGPTTLALTVNAAMQRLGNFPKHVDTFDLDSADIIHSWVDDEGVAFDLVMYGVAADAGQGSVYLFKAYDGEYGQRIYDSIGQMTGVNPDVLEVTDVQMNGSAITLAFDNDGASMKMIVNASGDDVSFGKKSMTIESTRIR